VDWSALCKVKTLMHFAHFAEDEKEKAQLIRMGTEEKDKFQEEKRSIYEVLEEFPSINIPFNAFIELVPRIQPRFYTISSSSKATPNRIAITVSLSVTQLTRGRVHKGLCSNYLCEAKEGKDKICIFVRPSAFRLPKQKATPVIMVGPGTGVAPFRAFLHDLLHFHKEKKEDVKVGDWYLFFGCRHKDKDYIYKKELEEAGEKKVLAKLDVAFSRMTEKKVYVQHRITEAGSTLWDTVHKEKASFYVCGGTAMGRDVRTALTTLAQTYGKLSAEEAAAYVAEMQKRGRYIQELWS
jgi:NADPH-ferrihemoprotein reductase